MPTARLEAEIPERLWIGDVSRSFPDAKFDVLSGMATERGARALVRVAGAAIESVREHAEGADGIDGFRVLTRTDDGGVFEHRRAEPPGFDAFREAGAMPAYPVSIQDGRVVVDVTDTRKRLTALLESLRDIGIDAEVVSLTNGAGASNLLTDRQRTVLAAALDCGYYDHPRNCTLTELAEELGVSKSSASDVLHRAESRVMTHLGPEIRP